MNNEIYYTKPYAKKGNSLRKAVERSVALLDYLAKELGQAIIELNVCTKFEENRSKISTDMRLFYSPGRKPGCPKLW